MNRRSFFTGLATLAVWPMAIRPRPRHELRVVTPQMFGAIPAEPEWEITNIGGWRHDFDGRVYEYDRLDHDGVPVWREA